MMDPWIRFEKALHTLDDPAPELRLVLGELDATGVGGTPAERQELRASATALLARAGEVPLSDAIEQCARAWELGHLGWPSLYLSWAALSQGQPRVALDSLAKVPDGYFEDRDLHWRTVQMLATEAEARLALGEHAEAAHLVAELNREFRSADVDEILAPPVEFVRAVLAAGPPYDLLLALVEGVDLEEWFPTQLVATIRVAIDRPHPTE